MESKFLQENGFLDDSTGKVSLADKLEGKTKQHIDNMSQEQINDLASLTKFQHLPERYGETKAKFLEATKDLEYLNGMLFYIENDQIKSEVITYDRKHYDEINSPFMYGNTTDRLTKQFVMELKEKYGIKK